MEFPYEFAKDLVRGAVNQLRYPCCFNNFVEKLKREEDDLIATRNSVQDRVAHGNIQRLETAEVVHKWLNDADIGIQDVSNLLERAITKKSCCFGHCPNWILRYHFGRKLANKTEELKEFNKEGGEYLKNIPQLQRVATLPPASLNFASDKYLKFESREYAFNQVMEAVKDAEVNLIGLHGMGGCGKTTLAEEVMKIAEAEHLFDKVLLVTVSSTVEVRSIQERIASSMQYTFQVNEERDRARALWDILTKEKKILVILDDVWERLDFGAIGIPLPEHHKGCKVLITTRSEDVCTSMYCQKIIPLRILADEEAWTLFQKRARIPDELKDLAREISDECKGLPVAIAAVAGSLNGKDEVIWTVALHRLRNSTPMNIEKGLRDPYNCLKLSYDNLDTEEAKSLFLLCSVFPEDYKIPIENLIKLAIGLGVVREVHSHDAARREVIAAKIKLVSSCLLILDADDDEECVKMHDLVRDVAHFIAEKENKVIKCQLGNEVTLEQSSIRYLWCKEEFPNDLDCSNLEFLHISTRLEILDANFKRMGKLRVLGLNNKEWNKRPLSTMSFATLTNLRCLILFSWELSDISFVRYTKKLQSLSLHRCSLPSFIDSQTGEFYKQLTKLKMLELVGCEMERNNYNVIGRIPQLEELRIKWDVCKEDNIEFLKTFSVPQTLQCYAIKLGDRFPYYIFSHKRMLALSCFDISNESIMGLAKRANVLCMENIVGGAKNMIPDIFQMKEDSMNELNKLQISCSEKIKCLVDTSNHLNEVPTLFSQLLLLEISEMDNLRVLWHGCLPPDGTFQKLEELEIKGCQELISLFTHTAVESVEEGMIECEYGKEHQIQNAKVELPSTMSSIVFQNLRKVTIRSCKKLKYVFSANTVRGLPQLKKLDIQYCYQLEQIIEDIIPSEASLGNHSTGPFTLFNLTSFMVKSCPKLRSLFTVSIAKTLTSLEELIIIDCDGLKHIVTSERAHKEDNHDLQCVISMFSSLKTVRIERCAKLEVIFPPCVTFQKLEKLYIHGCPELTYLFTHSTVKSVEVEGMIECEYGKDNHIQNAKVELPSTLPSTVFQNLQQVTIWKCEKLKYVFSANTVRGLPQLKELQIEHCNELEQIIEDIIPSAASHGNHSHSPGPFILSGLTFLRVESCPKLCSLFTVSTAKTLTSLEQLVIDYCYGLKHIVTGERAHKEDNHDLQCLISLFSSLKMLRITRCARLEVIFPPYVTFQKLEKLSIEDCPELTYLFTHSTGPIERAHKNEKEDIVEAVHDHQSFISTFPSLKTVQIKNCAELEVIFPLSCPLVENKYLPNLLSPQSHSAKLTKLIIAKCPKLKHVFSTSASIALSNLEILIINGCVELEELIGCKHGNGHQIEKAKVELPKLKLLIFINLLNLCHGIELLAVKHRVLYNCPKLTLTSTTTLEELHANLPDSDFENAGLSRWELPDLTYEINKSDEDLTSKDTSELPWY